MKNKIKGLLQIAGLNVSKYAQLTGKSQPNISNKLNRGTFDISELIELAELTNTKLAFIDDSGNAIITFDKSDLPEN